MCLLGSVSYDLIIICITCVLKGLGTDEEALIEIFMTRTNQQIQEMREVYGEGIKMSYITYIVFIPPAHDVNYVGGIWFLSFP